MSTTPQSACAFGVVPVSELQDRVLETLFNDGPLRPGALYLKALGLSLGTPLPPDSMNVLVNALLDLGRMGLICDNGCEFSLSHKGKRHILGLIVWSLQREYLTSAEIVEKVLMQGESR